MWIKTIYFKNRGLTISSLRLNLIFYSLLNSYSNTKNTIFATKACERERALSTFPLTTYFAFARRSESPAPGPRPVRARSAPASIECRLPKCIIIYLIYKPADLIGICHMWHNSFSQVNFSTNSSAMLCNNSITEKNNTVKYLAKETSLICM